MDLRRTNKLHSRRGKRTLLWSVSLMAGLCHLSTARAQPATPAPSESTAAVPSRSELRVQRSGQTVELVDAQEGTRLLAVDQPGGIGDFKRAGDVLFVVLRPRGVAVIDLKDGPTRLPDLATVLKVSWVETVETRLLLRAQDSPTTWVYSIENPRQPRFLEAQQPEAAANLANSRPASTSQPPAPSTQGRQLMLIGAALFGASYLPLVVLAAVGARSNPAPGTDYSFLIPVGGAIWSGGKAIGESGASLFSGISVLAGTLVMVDGFVQLAGLGVLAAGIGTWTVRPSPQLAVALRLSPMRNGWGLGISGTF